MYTHVTEPLHKKNVSKVIEVASYIYGDILESILLCRPYDQSI